MCRSEVDVGNYPPSVFYLIHRVRVFQSNPELADIAFLAR